MHDVSLRPHDYRFHTDIRVRLSETDAVGIVFFANYASYMDVGRMDYLEHLGLTRLDGAVRDLIPGAVVHTCVSFHAPARYNDVLTARVRIAELGNTSYTFHTLFTQKRTREPVARGLLKLVWLDDAFRPVPLPEDFRQTVLAYEQGRARQQEAASFR